MAQKLVVRHWEGGAGKFVLRLFQHVNDVQNAVGVGIEVKHV